jgi:hypothetical protein
MATALRMTDAAHCRVTVAASGAFGRRVAELLLPLSTHGNIVDSSDVAQAFGRATGAVILALWRPDRALCDRVDELAFSCEQPWLPIVMNYPVIRVGPLVCPPTGPCFGCSYRRGIQHDRHDAATTSIHAAYEADPDCGPAGYLPHHARLAAAVTVGMLRRFGSDIPRHADVVTGQTVTIGLINRNLLVSPVVPCYDCHRCGARRSSANSAELAVLIDRRRANWGVEASNAQCGWQR